MVTRWAKIMSWTITSCEDSREEQCEVVRPAAVLPLSLLAAVSTLFLRGAYAVSAAVKAVAASTPCLKASKIWYPSLRLYVLVAEQHTGKEPISVPWRATKVWPPAREATGYLKTTMAAW